ncbi:MAG: 23S rRNA (adenine(2503)-C(2))-methyltransferase RlmN [Planctomycetota bacterium]
MSDVESVAGPAIPAPLPPLALSGAEEREFTALVEAAGGKPFQARQLAHWIFRHGAADWSGCRNLPRRLLETLAGRATIRSSHIATIDSAKDGTEKLLLQLQDGETVETVLIPEGERLTLCVSSQVGCPVGCVFCASGLDGVRRNLSTAEIVDQVLWARDRLAERQLGVPPTRITNLVVMGLGEPMLNLDALLAALQRIGDPEGLALGARRITVSTSGMPARMRRFAEAPHAYNLAVSLHAADDELRRRLVPTAKASVAEIVEAARAFFAARGREVTFEVVLLAGVNDRPQDADALVRALRGFPCTVNLIPWNPVDRIEGLARPHDLRVDAFAESLRSRGLNVTVRRQRGADRSAACGQLRLRHRDGAPLATTPSTPRI